LQGNLKSLSETNKEKLKKSIIEEGFSFPIFCWQDKDIKYIMDAHQRLKVIPELESEGYTIPKLPTDFIEARNKKHAIKKLLLLNSNYGTMTSDSLNDLLTFENIEIKDYSDLLEIPNIEMNDFLDIQEKPDLTSKKKINILATDTVITVGDKPRTFGLVDELEFKMSGKYDFPILSDMIMTDSEIGELTTFANDKADKPPYLYIYQTLSKEVQRNILPQSIIGFYTGDVALEGIYNQPSIVTQNIINYKVKGCVMVDFSTYFNSSNSIQLYNIYRSLWVARYWQESGVKIIPSLLGSKKNIEDYLKVLPKHTTVCFQLHRKYNNDEFKEKRFIISEMISKLEPSQLIIYGEPKSYEKIKDIVSGIKVQFLETFINNRHKIIKEENNYGKEKTNEQT